jgi:hypothetical protein
MCSACGEREATSEPKAKSNRATISLIVLLLVIVGGWFAVKTGSNEPTPKAQPQFQTQAIIESAFTVPGSGYHYVQFAVPTGATNVKLQGQFSATGGTGNDVEVWAVTEDGFTNWKNGHATNTFYSSGRVTRDTLNVALPGGGAYYLVFNNKFSFLSPNAVQANVNMTYYVR